MDEKWWYVPSPPTAVDVILYYQRVQSRITIAWYLPYYWMMDEWRGTVHPGGMDEFSTLLHGPSYDDDDAMMMMWYHRLRWEQRHVSLAWRRSEALMTMRCYFHLICWWMWRMMWSSQWMVGLHWWLRCGKWERWRWHGCRHCRWLSRRWGRLMRAEHGLCLGVDLFRDPAIRHEQWLLLSLVLGNTRVGVRYHRLIREVLYWCNPSLDLLLYTSLNSA